MLQAVTVTAEQERMLREQDWGLLTEDERAQMYRRDDGPLEVRITEGQVVPRTNYTPLIIGAIGLIAVMVLLGGRN